MHIEADALIDALRAAGMRATGPRRAVCTVIATHHGEHLTAAQILEYAEGELESDVDRATVYRTLEALEEAGQLRHSHIGHGPTVYHLAEESPHQHLVCVDCGRTTAVPGEDLEELFATIATATGFVPDPEHFALGGRCADCAARAARRR